MAGCRHPLTGEAWVRCAQCDGPVERMELSRDGLARQHVIRVFCHGRDETVRVDYDLLTDGEIQLGDAFLAALS
jgi:hypothetical protein